LTEVVLLADYDALRDKSYRDARLGPHVVDWLAWLELGGASPRTIDQYERDLSRLCQMFPTKGIDDLTYSELLHVVTSFPQKSRRVRKAAFDSFFKWAVRCRRLEVNPMAMLPVIKRQPQRWIDTFDDAEIEALTHIGLVDAVLMRILLDAGLRKGEARHLRVGHAKLGTSELIVLGGKGGKDRVVPMGGQLATAIADLVLLEGLGGHDYFWYSHPGGGKPRRDRPVGEGSFARWCDA
jgi:site-specific recombinase XerD